MQYTIRHNNGAEWRNVNNTLSNSLDQLLRDAIVLPISIFSLIYGPKTFRWRAADNSMRVASFYRSIEVKPLIKPRKSEHKTPPRKGDMVVIHDSGEFIYGKLTWVNREADECGVFWFKQRELDTIDLSLLEANTGRVRWRIMR